MSKVGNNIFSNVVLSFFLTSFIKEAMIRPKLAIPNNKNVANGSTYKGFKLINHNKQLQWCGDYDANFNLIICKHKSPETIIFDVIKILPL